MFNRKTFLALRGRREPGQAVLRKANDPRILPRLQLHLFWSEAEPSLGENLASEFGCERREGHRDRPTHLQ